ncbi:allergen [Pyrenophora seminiperda CCB06]|uniref:Allergen n=1 Tax=Pyrenophora seminiperda CCB06 TaxID=1302712 RepID=A0A3M7M398_9PLEO|nr:allergen [Pyrenophora seminiperda CCB06]
MDKAKAAITDFMGRSGHHDTTVHEAVAPAVHHEVIKPHVHEEVNTAIDKEVHQDHYHRTVQPVLDREVLPEQHTAKLGAVQHREFDHRDTDATKRALVDDQTRFADERRIDETTHSRSVAPTIGGEHIHHHIHETIQPVVQKETIQPSVIHTTVPIHEVHHNKATHHETTALPAMTMDQFKAKGGALTGREERYDEFEGVPKNIGGATGMGVAEGLTHKSTHHSHEHARHGDFESTPNHHGAGTKNPLDRNNDGRIDSHDMKATGTNNSHGEVIGGSGSGDLAHRPNEDGSLPKALTEDRSRAVPHTAAEEAKLNEIQGREGQHQTGQHKNPSLMDKLNPKVDADGDGKAGFMK